MTPHAARCGARREQSREMPKPPNPNRSYNTYFTEKGDDFQRAHKTTHTSAATLRAFEELEYISSWAQFMEVCEEQKRKRGW